jgi:hypothetical protein
MSRILTLHFCNVILVGASLAVLKILMTSGSREFVKRRQERTGERDQLRDGGKAISQTAIPTVPLSNIL